MTASSEIIAYELTFVSIPKNFDKASTTQVNSVSNQIAMAKKKGFNYLLTLIVTDLWDHAYLQPLIIFSLIRKPISDA